MPRALLPASFGTARCAKRPIPICRKGAPMAYILIAGVWCGGVIFLWWLSDVAYGVHWILGFPLRLAAIGSLAMIVLAAPATVLEAGRSVMGKSDLRPAEAILLAIVVVAAAAFLVTMWLSGRL